MDFLTDNPLINLRGPAFLGVFALIAGLSIFAAWRRSKAVDPTRKLRPPQVPEVIDPFDVAFLRGGYADLVRLTILDLVGRGFLVPNKSGDRILMAPKPPSEKYLNGTALSVFEWMKSSKSAEEIVSDLIPRVESRGREAERQRKMEAEQWLLTGKQRQASWNAAAPFILLVVVLFFWKFFVAIQRGHANVFFLIVMVIAAVVLFFHVATPPRRTALGTAFFERLNTALSRMNHRLPALITSKQHDHVLLVVATFGLGVLAGTEYDFMATMFQKAAKQKDSDDAGSGCGSSCGSSSSGGGSCGGGCGGCGGD